MTPQQMATESAILRQEINQMKAKLVNVKQTYEEIQNIVKEIRRHQAA